MANTRNLLTAARKLLKMLLPAAQQPSTTAGPPPRLGDSSVRTTQEIYAHMITGQDEEAARKWEEYQKRNRTVSQPAKAVQ